MIRMEENYFIKRYVGLLKIDARVEYRSEGEVKPPKEEEDGIFLDLSVASKRCVTLLLTMETKSDDKTIRRFYLYDMDEESYRMVPYILPTNELPLHTEYKDEMLLLHYKKHIDIFSLRTGNIATIHKEALSIVAGDRVYVLDKDSKASSYKYNGAFVENIDPADSGDIVAIDYSDKLHFLTLKNGSLFLDGKKCEGVEAVEVDYFSWLGEEEFIFCGEKGLFHYDYGDRRTIASECEWFDVDCMKNLWLLENGNLVKFQRRSFYEEKKSTTIEFDSFKESTEWSRLELEMKRPEHTRVELSVESDSFKESFVDVDKMVLYGHRGDKLKVMLTLFSDSTRTITPEISSVRAVFDATGYIEYLPSCYREEPETLHRFLSIFQTVTKELESRVEKIPRLLDVRRADEEFLTWLSMWLGLQRDFRWPTEKWREFLARAPELYAISGTAKGLTELLKIYTGTTVEIDEYDEVGKHFFFCVRIDPESMDEEVDIEVVQAIVEEFKPAHTRARVIIDYEQDKRPRMVVGESILPFNTMIEKKKERQNG